MLPTNPGGAESDRMLPYGGPFRLSAPARASYRLVELTIVVLAVVSITVSLTASAAADTRLALFGATVALAPTYIPGDYITFHCDNGMVTLNGTTDCNNQSTATTILPSGSWVMEAIPLSHFHTWNWTTTGDACPRHKACMRQLID